MLRQWSGKESLLHHTARFYFIQLHRHAEAVEYLYQRGINSLGLVEHMRVGYAPGGCLRGELTGLGYPLCDLRQAGLVTAAGYDAYIRRFFRWTGNLYGGSLSASASPHRFLPGANGGLYRWEHVRRHPKVILIEGLFDYATLWQAGFQNVTCSLGTHLNTNQFRQLCDATQTVYLALFNPPTNLRTGEAKSVLMDLTSANLSQPGLTPLLPDRRTLIVPAFTDLKLHDITDPNDRAEAEPLDMNWFVWSRSSQEVTGGF